MSKLVDSHELDHRKLFRKRGRRNKYQKKIEIEDN